MSEQYAFPEVYVAGVRSKKCLCNESEKYIIVSCTSDLNACTEVYGHIPYEQVLNYIDSLEAKMRESVVVLQSRPDRAVYKGFLLEKGTSVCLQEISGNYVYLHVKEGMSVKKEHSIAHIITGKLEIRNIRSLCEGLVALVVDMPWKEPRKVVVVVTNVHRPIATGKST